MIVSGIVKALIFFGLCFTCIGVIWVIERCLEWWENNDNKTER